MVSIRGKILGILNSPAVTHEPLSYKDIGHVDISTTLAAILVAQSVQSEAWVGLDCLKLLISPNLQLFIIIMINI